ncbi:MAG: hypothetical protein M1820_010892 [Bogoriella megaspora]|nr:MAG: hypothetical protein M1820_010892 [Bogoriella megaspora]
MQLSVLKAIAILQLLGFVAAGTERNGTSTWALILYNYPRCEKDNHPKDNTEYLNDNFFRNGTVKPYKRSLAIARRRHFARYLPNKAQHTKRAALGVGDVPSTQMMPFTPPYIASGIGPQQWKCVNTDTLSPFASSSLRKATSGGCQVQTYDQNNGTRGADELSSKQQTSEQGDCLVGTEVWSFSVQC